MNYLTYHKPQRYKKPNKIIELLCEILPVMMLGSLLGIVLAILYAMGKQQGIY